MVQRKSVKHLLIVLLLSSIVIFATQVFSTVSPQDLKQTILVLDRARSNGIVEFHQAIGAGSLTGVERKEFRTFINYLGRRINHYCEELKISAPSEDTAELPCDFQEADRLPDFVELPQLPPLPAETTTTGDQVASLDQSLNDALEEFDAMLLEEQQKLASKKEAQGGEASGGSGSEREQDKGELTGTSSNQGTQSEQAGQGSKASQQGTQAPAISGGTGSDDNRTRTAQEQNQSGMGDDDDIVARQLREAAEKETDPEIKEKLWEEYRKYKEGVN